MLSRMSLVLSCEPSVAMRWLIPRLASFQAAHPDIALHLVGVGGGPVEFRRDRIDLAIRRLDFALPEAWHVQRLFPEKVGPVMSPQLAPVFASGSTSLWVQRPGRTLGRGGFPPTRRCGAPRRFASTTTTSSSLKPHRQGRALPSARGSLQPTILIEGDSSHLPASIPTKATMADLDGRSLNCPGKRSILLYGCKSSARVSFKARRRAFRGRY